MSGQSRKATRWRRNRKFGDVYGGRNKAKLSENVFERCHSLSRPDPTRKLPILIEDNPSRDFFFPLSVEECWEAVQALPQSHIEGITHIWCRRPSSRRGGRDSQPLAEYICGSGVRVIVIYPWPRSMRMVHGNGPLTGAFANELRRYGAVLKQEDGNMVSYWSLSLLKRYYINAILYHEVGHHVDLHYRRLSKANRRAGESFADEYSMQRTATAVHVLNKLERA